jgi:hypothetical protein
MLVPPKKEMLLDVRHMNNCVQSWQKTTEGVYCMTIWDKIKKLVLLVLLQDLGMQHKEDHI